VGFAIPADTTQEIVTLLRKYGYLRIGWLGVEGATLTPEMINGLGLKVKSGAVVANVLPGPARNIIEPGDVIYEINGANLEDMRMLRRDAATSLGKRIKLKVLRDGRSETVSVAPAEWPAARQTAIMQQKPAPASAGMAMDLGFECSPLSEPVRSEYNLEPAQRGVAVTAIHSNSPAADSGLQIGDVVVAVQLQPMQDPVQVKAKIKEAIAANRDYVTLLVRSRDQFKYLTLPLKWQAPVEAAMAKDNG
jgi:serine protease Do